MKTLSELRSDARMALKGNWLTSVLFVFVYAVIACIISGVFQYPVASRPVFALSSNLVSVLLVTPLAYGLMYGFLRQQRGEEIEIGNLFSGFNLRVWSTMILTVIYTFLWCLLLLIPGIIKNYSYSMTSFILADEPELSNNAAIEKSMEMMSGNKMRLFLLDLSFIGWALLSLLTFGIGMLWVGAYMYQAHAAFYEELKAQNAE